MKNKVKKWGAIIIIVGVAIFLANIYKERAVYTIRAYYEQELSKTELNYKDRLTNTESKVDREIAKKVEKLQSEIVETLGKCETGGIPEELRDSAIILDTNKEISIGRFMFQRDTVIYYYKKLYKKDITRDEAVRISVTHELSSKLASDILFGEKEGWRNWYNCSKRHGLPAQIELINKIK